MKKKLSIKVCECAEKKKLLVVLAATVPEMKKKKKLIIVCECAEKKKMISSPCCNCDLN